MSTVDLIIEERAADIGNFIVGRLLPFRQKRAVGPFVFIDHMGPAKLGPSENLDVPPHPHIGLSTLTYLFEGSIMHKDSLGTEEEIKPGAVNWMTAGKGIVHSERTPNYLRTTDKTIHGFQIWVALPKNLEQMEPSFVHIAADQIPAWQEGETHFKLIAGSAFGKKSPVPVYSPLYLIEIKSKQGGKINIGEHLFGECAIYILEGSIVCEGSNFQPKQLLISKTVGLCEIEMKENTTIYIFGGDAFPEERFIYWNLVSSDKALIEKAKEDWLAQKFPVVPGEKDFVPLPDPSSKK